MCILIFSQIVFLTNYSVSQNSLSNNNTIWKTQGNAIQLTGDIIFKGYEGLQDPMNRFLMINKTGTTTPLKMSVMK